MIKRGKKIKHKALLEYMYNPQTFPECWQILTSPYKNTKLESNGSGGFTLFLPQLDEDGFYI